MEPKGQRANLARIVVAVAAIYALLVAAFVPRALALPGSPAAAAICLHDGSAAPDDTAPPHDHRGCCTAAPHAAALPAGPTHFLPVRWPAADRAFAPLRPEADRLPTGPPVRSTSPRGPPPA